MMTSDRDFQRRAADRRLRMSGLVSLHQTRQIPVKKFRYLANLLKAEHNRDARESGIVRGREL
jgi:hypothetical protein